MFSYLFNWQNAKQTKILENAWQFLILNFLFFFSWITTPKSAEHSKLNNHLLCISMWICDCQNICGSFTIPGSIRHFFPLRRYLYSRNTFDCPFCSGNPGEINWRNSEILLQTSSCRGRRQVQPRGVSRPRSRTCRKHSTKYGSSLNRYAYDQLLT